MSQSVHPIADSAPLACPPSDQTLIRYVRGGDEAAAEELYRRYASRLRELVSDRCSLQFASRFDADDVVQSVFRVLYEGVQTRFYEVPQGGELWGLLFVLAMNKMRDLVAIHRAACRNVYRTATDTQSLETLFAKDESTATLLRLTVEEHLNGLDETDRAIVALRMTGHSIDEVAERLGRAKRTIERVLQKARDQLAKLLLP